MKVVDIDHVDFIKVMHGKSVQKVKAHRTQGKLSNWIQNCLGDRSQRILLEGCGADCKSVTNDVLQGLVLRSLLFVLYINDLNVNVGGTN